MVVVEQLKQLGVIFLPQDRRQFGVLVVAMLAGATLQVAGVAAILPFMQLVAQPGMVAENEWLRWAHQAVGFESDREMLLWSGVLVIVLFTASVAVAAVSGWMIQRSVWATAHRLCLRQLLIYMQLPYEFFLQTGSTELLRRVVADVNKLLTDVLLAGSQAIAQAALAAGLFVLMLVVNPVLTLLAFMIFGGVYAVLHLARYSYLVRLGRERLAADERRYATFAEAVTGMKSIRVADARAYFLGRFSDASQEYSRVFPRLELASNLPRHLMEVIAFSGIILVVLYFASEERGFLEVVPTLSLFALATYRLMPALHMIFSGAARVSNSLPVIESVARDMRTDRCLEPAPGPGIEPLGFEDEIRLRGIRFQYETAPAPSLAGIDITIKRGERVAFVGATGSGKTTLIDVAVGLLLPEEGALEVDGVGVGPENVAAWRRIIGYVPQDVFLYDDTIARNITFGDEPDEGRLREAARAARIADFIERELPAGYETRIGERGVRLSGGQRQRLGLARALYRQPQVLLLDEATSALDGVTEEAVMGEMRARLPDLTVIMIAHRLSTVRDCDRIYLIEGGRLETDGAYDELYRTSSSFRKMVETTTGKA